MANKREGGSKPTILNITAPEVKKIKQPTKYYVYKLIVEWSNGHMETIYRRYSQFFDFQAKLLELFEDTEDINGLLPELPGKILFGRSQVHHVAEKRRRKIEEFCQAVYKLPPAIAESSVVQGFFSIWPEDTSGSDISSVGFKELLSPTDSSGSLSIPTSPTHTKSDYEMWGSTDIPINEELLQYRATENYTKKDSQQVNLSEGQTVLVIERCDTGWWMVLVGDEQGYAPASLLEPIDGSSSGDDDVYNDQEGLYEAVGEYKAVNHDELNVKQGDTVQVINRCMDGWWEISSGGKTGYVPGSVMMKTSTLRMLSSLPSASQVYCKDMNAVNPPPRRNKAGKTSDGIYDIPRKDKLSIKTHTTPPISDEEEIEAVYAIPRLSTSSTNRVDGPSSTAEAVKTSDTNGADHIYEMESPVDRSSSPQQTNRPALKKKPQVPKKMIKSSSVSEGVPSLITGSVRVRSHTSIEKATTPERPEEDYVKMNSTVTSPPLDQKDISATGPRKKNRSVVPSKPQPYAKRSNPSPESSTRLSPLLHRLSRSYSFGDILDLNNDSPDWPSIVDKRESPKASRPMMFGSVIRSNTNASNNRKVSANSSEELSDNYIELNWRTLIETFTAVKDYVAQSNICLSFNTGDCCALLRKTEQNWWLVNIGGKEGWVPGTFWMPSSHLTASKFVSPPLFPPPERQEKPDDYKVYTNQVVCKQPLSHTKSNPAVPDKPKKVPPPKPKLPADLAADIRVSKKLQSPSNDENIPPATPSRFTSLRSISSRGSTPDPDIIASNRNSNGSSNDYENSLVDYENSETIVASLSSSQELQRTSPVQGRTSPPTPGHEQKPTVPNRSRSETSFNVTPNKKPSMVCRERADTVGDVLAPAPSVKPRSMTVTSFPQRKHDYEEIIDDIEQQSWFFGRMNREATETLLKEHGRQCEFLIRERSNKNGFYALSIKHHLSVRHFNIDPVPSTNTFIMGTMKFNSIQDVIKHYQENSLFLNNGVAVKLGQPVRKRTRVEPSTRKS